MSGRPRRRIPLWARIVFAVAVLAASVWFVVLPQVGSAEKALRSLQQPPVLLLIASALAEAASIAAYSALTVRLMGRNRLSYFTALRFRLFVRSGIPRSEALSGATVEITVSNLALGLLFCAGLAATLTALGSNSYYLVALGADEV